jgi:catechol 2,3-dioxygenase-like lactoylglutathione lyase family enzyme
MARMHIHIAVDDLERNTGFYRALFGVEPTVVKGDYVKWELEDPAVNFAISSRGRRAGLDHVGIQAGSEAELAAIRARLDAADIAGAAEEGAACCYARSDKYWVQDPQGIPWETFHTLDSIPTFNEAQASASDGAACCIPVIPVNRCC